MHFTSRLTAAGLTAAFLFTAASASANDSVALTLYGVDGYEQELDMTLAAGSSFELQKLSKFYSDRIPNRPDGFLTPREQKDIAGVCNRLAERGATADPVAADLITNAQPGDRFEWKMIHPDGRAIACTFVSIAGEAPDLDTFELITGIFTARAKLDLGGVVVDDGANDFVTWAGCMRDYMSNIGGNHSFGSANRICRQLTRGGYGR